MNYDMALVTEVLETGNYKEAIKAGIKKEMLGDLAGLYWDVISEFYHDHGKVPSVPYFKSLCPNYDHSPTGEPISVLVDDLKRLHLGNALNDLLSKVVEANNDDAWKAKRLLVQLTDKLNIEHQFRNTRTVAGEMKDYVLEMLYNLRDGFGLAGMPWPFEPLNKRTPGIMPGNVIYLYGRQKSKKTWVMLHMALFLSSLGYRVLFFTREMTVEELHWRLGALLLGIPIEDYTKGKVTESGIAIVNELLDDILKSGKLIFSENREGIVGYKTEIEDVNPDIVMHDYWKAMADDAMGDKIGASEKRYVDATIDQLVDYHAMIKVPAIICGHANREGDKTRGRGSTEHAWSDHITRRVHAAIRVVKSGDDRKIGLVVNAGRAVPEDVLITLDGNLCMGFGDVLDVDGSWIFTSEASREESDNSKQRKEEPAPASKIKVGPAAFRAIAKSRKQTNPTT